MIEDIATSFQAASNPSELKESLLSALKNFGYNRFVYALIPTLPPAVMGEYIALNNIDTDWMLHYTENEWHKHDVLAAHCMEKTFPWVWTDMYAQAEQNQFTTEQSNVAFSARDVGFKTGVTVPLRQIGSFRAGISLICDGSVGSKEHDRHFKAHQQELIMLADTFHANMDLRRLTSEYYQPTVREIEVLKWLSLGLHEKQIAQRLGNSVSTVEKQVRSAKRRLRCATSTQAVAKAVMLGLIH